MTVRRTVLCGMAAAATMVVTAVAGIPASSASPTPLKRAQAQVSLIRGSNGTVHALAAVGKPVPPKGLTARQARTSPKAAARATLAHYASAFGVKAGNLRAIQARSIAGGHVVRYQQYMRGLPVYAGQLVVSQTRSGAMQSITGEVARGTFVGRPLLLKKTNDPMVMRAASKAEAYVAKQTHLKVSQLHATSRGLWVFNGALLDQSLPDVNARVVRFDVTADQGAVNWTVMVTPRRFVVFAFDANPHALHRYVCDNANTATVNATQRRCDGTNNAYVRTDGQLASSITDVNQVFDSLHDTALAYANYTNLDLTALIGTTDGNAGEPKALRATTRVCALDSEPECPMLNAFWNSTTQQMVYGQGMTSLDITGHELTHGVTAHTSNLLYVYQSGALNESMSDVLGELTQLGTGHSGSTDRDDWLIGEDSAYGPLRNMSDPATAPAGYQAGVWGPWSPQPDRMTSTHWYGGTQDNGGVHENSGVGNKTAYLIGHGGTFNGYTVRGLGYAKTFKIYWTLDNLLTPGSDYKDLFSFVQLACQKYLDRPASYITADDCAQVGKAVRATELYKDAAVNPPVATPYCPAGQTVDKPAIMSQGFDSFATSARWTFSPGNTGLANATAGFPYAVRGKDAAILGAGNQPAIITSPAVAVPAGGAWMRTDYAVLWDTQPTTSLQYSTDDGTTWRDAGTLAGSVNAGPWTTITPGWSSAKLDLSSLAGQTVRFRVMVAAGVPTRGLYALAFLDNFKVYTCS